MRRDLINSEIANLRDLLPLPSSTRQRLSQLQLMALVLVYVRKSNYFDQGNTPSPRLMQIALMRNSNSAKRSGKHPQTIHLMQIYYTTAYSNS